MGNISVSVSALKQVMAQAQSAKLLHRDLSIKDLPSNTVGLFLFKMLFGLSCVMRLPARLAKAMAKRAVLEGYACPPSSRILRDSSVAGGRCASLLTNIN